MWRGSRAGRPVPIAAHCTTPSTRKACSRKRRAPWPASCNCRQSSGSSSGEGGVDRLPRHHRFEEVARGQEVGRRPQRAERARAEAGGGIERRQQLQPEALRQRPARLPQQVADAAQAEPVQRGDAGRRQAQCLQGQGGDGDRLLARRHDDPDASARQARGAIRRAGDGGVHGDAGAGETGDEGAAQRLLAAMQMGDAGDVQQQPVRRVERRQRGDAARPMGEAAQPGGIGLRRMRVQRDLGQDGLGIGQGLAGAEAGGGGLPG